MKQLNRAVVEMDSARASAKDVAALLRTMQMPDAERLCPGWMAVAGNAEREEDHVFRRSVLPAIEGAEIWKNDEYQVSVRRGISFHAGAETMAHLSIKRIDKEAVHDWRHFQEIKNQLVGKECEGVELYPAESRLIDTANQYHMFVYEDSSVTIPVGFDNGRVVTDFSGLTTKQRKVENV